MLKLFLHAENTLKISVLRICCIKARIGLRYSARVVDDLNYFFNAVKLSFLQQQKAWKYDN